MPSLQVLPAWVPIIVFCVILAAAIVIGVVGGLKTAGFWSISIGSAYTISIILSFFLVKPFSLLLLNSFGIDSSKYDVLSMQINSLAWLLMLLIVEAFINLFIAMPLYIFVFKKKFEPKQHNCYVPSRNPKTNAKIMIPVALSEVGQIKGVSHNENKVRSKIGGGVLMVMCAFPMSIATTSVTTLFSANYHQLNHGFDGTGQRIATSTTNFLESIGNITSYLSWYGDPIKDYSTMESGINLDQKKLNWYQDGSTQQVAYRQAITDSLANYTAALPAINNDVTQKWSDFLYNWEKIEKGTFPIFKYFTSWQNQVDYTLFSNQYSDDPAQHITKIGDITPTVGEDFDTFLSMKVSDYNRENVIDPIVNDYNTLTFNSLVTLNYLNTVRDESNEVTHISLNELVKLYKSMPEAYKGINGAVYVSYIASDSDYYYPYKPTPNPHVGDSFWTNNGLCYRYEDWVNAFPTHTLDLFKFEDTSLLPKIPVYNQNIHDIPDPTKIIYYFTFGYLNNESTYNGKPVYPLPVLGDSTNTIYKRIQPLHMNQSDHQYIINKLFDIVKPTVPSSVTISDDTLKNMIYDFFCTVISNKNTDGNYWTIYDV